MASGADRPPGPSPATGGASGRALWAVALLLLVATLAAYAPALDAGFLIYDDPQYVLANPQVPSGLTREGVVWAFTAVHDSNWIPLVWLSLMLDHELFGDDPRGYHATNLALHALATLLLLAALRRFTGELWRPAFVAGCFALHPLHVQSVAWIAERKDVLSGVFWMLTLLAWARYVQAPGLARYAAVFASLALGLLCKATAVTLPFVLLLLDFWPAGRLRSPSGDARETRRLVARALVEKVPLLALAALSSLATLQAQSLGGSVAKLVHLPLETRVANAVVSYLAYLGKTFWPTDLTFFYPHPELAPGDPRVLASAAALLAITALCLGLAWQRRDGAPLLVGWLWFLGTLVPMIGIVQVGAQGMADRYMYLPLVGLALAVAWCPGLPRRAERAAGALAALALAALAAASFVEAGHWRDSERLYRRALAVDADNDTGHYELARLLNSEGRHAEAEPHAREATRLRPAWSDAYLHLGVALLGQERPDEAVKALHRSLARDPSSLEARRFLARALVETGQLVQARGQLDQLLVAQPGDVLARIALGELAERQGDRAAAWQSYAFVCQIAPGLEPGRTAARHLVRLVASWPEAPPEAVMAASRAAALVPGDGAPAALVPEEIAPAAP